MEPQGDRQGGGAHARQVNADYYREPAPGRADYWRRMAAPRFRVATFLQILQETPPGRVADLGCGSGELLREIRRAFPGAALCGVDLSPEQIAANAARDSAIEWRTLDLGVVHDFPEGLASSFDIIIASEIIEHVEEPHAFLTNARSLAAPGSGRLLLSTQSGRVWETERRVGHRRHFSASELRTQLYAAGWQPLEVWNSGWPFHDLSKWLANRRPEATMRAYSERPYGWRQRAVCRVLRAAFQLNARHRGAQLFALAAKAG